MVTIVALKLAMSSHCPLPKHFVRIVPALSNGASRTVRDRKPKTDDQILPRPILCVRCARCERERDTEREREREREIDGSDVTIIALKLAMSLHFPLPKIRLFHFSLFTSCLSFLKWSPLWRWNSQWVHTLWSFRCQKNSPSLFRLYLEWREPRNEWSKTQEKWSNSAESYCSSIEKMTRINTKNYWK